MGDIPEFSGREDFRQWLCRSCQTSARVWLVFGRAGGPKPLRASEAPEEALCLGRIDGQTQRVDAYRKYFAMRRDNSRWSARNRALAQRLEEQVSGLTALLEGAALANFQAMPLSVRRTYARAYFDAKTEAGREKRLAWITDRLHKNLRPM